MLFLLEKNENEITVNSSPLKCQIDSLRSTEINDENIFFY